MPYIQGGGDQKDSGLPSVKDVYHSSNVFVNNVAVALWQAPGNSSAFSSDVAVAQLTFAEIDVAALTASQILDNQYESNPRPFAMPSDAVAQGAVEPYYQGTPEPISTATGVITTATFDGGLIEWLTARLGEADQGMWNRTYQATGVNNSNILSMWEGIGLGDVFTSDTTPWCMGFVNFGLKQCGYKWCPEAAAASIQRSPTRWSATSIPLDQGQPGDIALWQYGNGNHVNFIYSVTNGKYVFVGGNQSGQSASNNNPSRSSVTKSWPGGWSQTNNKPGSRLVGLWRPTQT